MTINMRQTTSPPVPPPRRRRGLAAAVAAATWHCAALAVAPGGEPDTTPDLTALPFEQLLAMEVFSASKFVQQAHQAPSSVTVIRAADIRAHGWRTLADILRSVRGAYVANDRNYSYLGARGFLRPGDYNTRFLLQVDGNRINDAVYDQAPVGGEFPLDLELVERIEFVPGPGSSIYGSNAFFGVVNVITRKTGGLQGTRATLEAGQAGVRRAAASLGWRSAAGSDFLLSASRHRSDGRDLYYREFDTPEQNHGVAHGLDYERGGRLFARATRGPLNLTMMHAERVKGVPTASYLQPFNDPRSRTTDRQTYASLAWGRAAGGDGDIKARLFWGAYDSYGDYVLDDGARTLSLDGSAGRWWGAELTLLSTRLAGHTLLAGLDYQHDYRLHQINHDVAPRTVYLDDRRRARRAGIYLQDEVALGASLLLNAGLRYDRNGGAAGVLSPRGALIWQAGAQTTVKAIVGSAYRAPNSYEKYYTYPAPEGQLPNPSLARETIRSAELALVHQLGASGRITAHVFRNRVGALITLTAHPALDANRFENAAPLSARGAELEYERLWPSGAALRTSYSAIRARAAAGADEGMSAPARLAKLNLAAPLPLAGLQAGAEAQYVSVRRGPAGRAGAYWIVNTHLLAARLAPGLDASLTVSNLFDRRYADPGSAEHLQAAIAQDGRRLRVRLAYVF